MKFGTTMLTINILVHNLQFTRDAFLVLHKLDFSKEQLLELLRPFNGNTAERFRESRVRFLRRGQSPTVCVMCRPFTTFTRRSAIYNTFHNILQSLQPTKTGSLP